MLTEITDDQKTDHDVEETKVKHKKIYFIIITYNINNLPVKPA